MNWRERLADWISGGKVALYRNELAQANKYILEERRYFKMAADVANDNDVCFRAILTARNITEARKIARQALGETE